MAPSMALCAVTTTWASLNLLPPLLLCFKTSTDTYKHT